MLGKNIYFKTQKAQTVKEKKISKLNFIKTKTSCSSKDTVEKNVKGTIEGENTLQYLQNTGEKKTLLARTYKVHLNSYI